MYSIILFVILLIQFLQSEVMKIGTATLVIHKKVLKKYLTAVKIESTLKL